MNYVNVINKGTTEVGFAINGPVVVGFYCPPAPTEAAELMKAVPTEKREAPKPPQAPEGVELLDTTDAPCPVITPADGDTPAVRMPCS